MIKLDKREPQSVVDALISTPIWEGIPISIELLPIGDYVFSYKNRKGAWTDAFAWESKTWTDLMGSLTKPKAEGGVGLPRILKQLTRLQASFPNGAGLMIKGRLDTWSWEVDPLDRRVKSGNVETQWTVKSLKGFLLTCQSRGIIVQEIPNIEQLPYYLRFWHNHFITHRLDSDHFARGASIPTAMLDMIPTIGPDKAQKVWKGLGNQRGSLSTLIEANEVDLAEYVGPISAREIWSRLH